MPNQIVEQGSGLRSNDYCRILANVALYFEIGNSSLAGTFTFQKEHKAKELGSTGIQAYRSAALSSVDKLAYEEIAQFIKFEIEPDSANISEGEFLSLARKLIARQIIEERLEGKTYYLKARLVVDPEQMVEALDLAQYLSKKIEELNEAKARAEEVARQVERLEEEVRQAKIKAGIVRKIQEQPEESEEVRKLLYKARLSFSQGDYPTAIDLYSSILQAGVEMLECYLFRGCAYFHMEQYAKAAADFSSAIELDPFNPLAYHNRASSRVKNGELNDGIKDYERAISLKEDYAEAYKNRGVTYMKYIKDYERALSDFNRVLSLQPEEKGVYFLRGTLYGKMLKFEDAYQDYLRALEGIKANPWLYYNMGNCLLRMGRYNEAIESYTKAIELRADVPAFYHNRGLAYARQDLVKEALDDYNKALELGPEDGKSIVIRGFLFWKIGEKDKAIGDWQKAAQMGENRGIDFLRQLDGC